MSKKILLADDSVTIQKVVELTFMDEGFEVTAVGNGDDATAQVEHLQPDLVIADVHMPGASGYEVCRFVKSVSPATPVMLLVGTFQPFDEGEAQACGADDHLKKPFDSQELFRRVESLMAGEPEAAETEMSPEVAEPPAVGVVEAEVEPESEPVEEPVAESQPGPSGAVELSDEDVERIARRVVELLGDDVVREVSWEVIPDLAEVVIKDRLRDLESQVD